MINFIVKDYDIVKVYWYSLNDLKSWKDYRVFC